MRRTTKFYKYERKYYTQLYIFFRLWRGSGGKKALDARALSDRENVTLMQL